MRWRTIAYRNAEILLSANHRLKKEIEQILDRLELAPSDRSGCPALNAHQQIQRAFVAHGWRSEALVSPRTGKRHFFDLFKDRVAIEIELTNRELLYRDYHRFYVAEVDGRIDVGIIVLLEEQARGALPAAKANGLPRIDDVAADLACLRGALTAPVWVVSLY
jgi:hypothetical protein